MYMRLLLSVIAVSVASQACNKTVVSDKVVPVKTPDTSPTRNNGNIEGQAPDIKSKIRISKAACNAERKTEFQVKVRGLVGTDWIRLSCDDIKSGKEFEVDSKKGYCNVLELKAEVSFSKTGLPSENYTRVSSNLSDKVFFKLEPVSGSALTSALKISFEDTNDEYWNKGFQYCSKNPAGTIELVPITGARNQSCESFIKDPGMAVDFNDFVFSVESNDVQFAVENQPEIGCKPGQ
ncbi:hypothetical protein EBR21_02300 [bacterium]|nr:hypothetical protein [bacterium]